MKRSIISIAIVVLLMTLLPIRTFSQESNVITLKPGWSWMPYTGSAPMSLAEALANINTPSVGDVVKAIDGSSATYSSAQGWTGTLVNLIPGLSYHYYSNADADIIFVLPEPATPPVPSSAIPSVTTGTLQALQPNSAMCGGSVTTDDNRIVLERGICWGETEEPTIANHHAGCGNALGNYSVKLHDLTPGNTYFVRAYAYNENGIAYGDIVTFNTPITVDVTLLLPDPCDSEPSGYNPNPNGCTNICANSSDTVTLRVGNFHYGRVQWQQSLDRNEWTDIENANDTLYQFLPTGSLFYRAQVFFPNCSGDYFSEVALVQLSPVAFAGNDRRISANMTSYMMATTTPGAIGRWSVISGTGGCFADDTNPHTSFIADVGTYQLVWTIMNDCGQDSDTITLESVNTVYNDNVVYVDVNDSVMSDSTQIVNGEYVIAFADPVPEIRESTLLIDYQNGDFFRKVTSFVNEDNVYIMQTVQGTLDDIIVEGVLEFNTMVDGVGDRGASWIVLDRFPTRKEMKENPELLRDGKSYLIMPQLESHRAIELGQWGIEQLDDGGFQISVTDFDVTLPNAPDWLSQGSHIRSFTYSGSMSFVPNFQCTYDKSIGISSFKFGLYDAKFSLAGKLSVDAVLDFHPVGLSPSLDASLAVHIPVGTLPMTIDFGPTLSIGEIKIENYSECTYSGESVFSFGVHYDDVLDRLVFNPLPPVLKYLTDFNSNGEFDENTVSTTIFESSVSLDVGVTIVELLSLSVGFGSPIRYEGVRLDSKHKSNETEGGWAAPLSLGVSLGDFLGYTFLSANLYENTTITKTPYRIEKIDATDRQSYVYGESVPDCIEALVLDSKGKPCKGYYVHFEPRDGTVEPEWARTDGNGVASTRWTPNLQEGEAKLFAKVYDGLSQQIYKSPLTYRAYPGENNPCSNSNLTVSVVKEDDLVVPKVSGGTGDYEFSTDGVEYAPQCQGAVPIPGNIYKFYVRDANGCEAEGEYMEPKINSSSLDLTCCLIGDNSVLVQANYGFEPYVYSVDGIERPGVTLFEGLAAGLHTFQVRDNLGFIDEKTVMIGANGSLYLSLSEITSTTTAISGHISINESSNLPMEKGICWSRCHAPKPTDNCLSYAGQPGDFDFLITGLIPSTTYYIRAYAVDSHGTSFSQEIAVTTGSSAPEGTLNGSFSINSTGGKVQFSKGNLQYRASTDTWRFAENQWDYVGEQNADVSSSYDGWIDLFGWGTSGYNHGAVCYQPWSISKNGSDYKAYGNRNYNLDDVSGQADWGYNAISNGGDQENLWRTLSYEEWKYLLYERNTSSGKRYTEAKVGDVNGLIIFPDNWDPSIYHLDVPANLGNNNISQNVWTSVLEESGCVFLPFGGMRIENSVKGLNGLCNYGDYWSSSSAHEGEAKTKSLSSDSQPENRSRGYSVRLVYQEPLAPSFSSLVVDEIFNYSVKVTGGVSDDGGSMVTEKGFCWSTNPTPTIDDEYVSLGSGTGNYSYTITNVVRGKTVYVRAFAVNDAGVSYSRQTEFFSPFNSDYTPVNGLVAYYKLDGDEVDSGPYAHHGSVIGNVTPTVDRFGNPNGAMHFPGEAFNYISIPDHADFHLDAFTLSAWIYSYDNYADGYILNKGRDIDNGSYRLYVQGVGATVCNGGINGAGITELPSTGQWHMVTGTVEGDHAKFYLDGVLVDEKTLSAPFSFNNTDPLVLGMHYYGGVPNSDTYPFFGDLDDVRIYNRVLSGLEIAQMYGDTPLGLASGIFTINEDGDQVYFSQGNLQYQASTNTWRFAEHQWDFVGSTVVNSGEPGGTVPGSSNHLISSTYDGWIDLFGWGTSGYDHGAVCYQPWSISNYFNRYRAYGNEWLNLFDQTGQADWGYNPISNGGNQEKLWRTLTDWEWFYIFNERMTPSHICYAFAIIDTIRGIVVVPDDWDINTYAFNDANTWDASFESNLIDRSIWTETLEPAGCVFLPAAGKRFETRLYGVGTSGNYWSSFIEPEDSIYAMGLVFDDEFLTTGLDSFRCMGGSVRLVLDLGVLTRANSSFHNSEGSIRLDGNHQINPK